MPIDESWDWALLFYAGTVTLRMSPGYFWRISPRKLDLLLQVHLRLNQAEEDNNKPSNYRAKPKMAYIDQIF